LAIVSLALLGAGVAGYVTWVHYSGALAFCAGSGGCEVVQASRYAQIGAMPVALLGLLMYVALAMLAVWRLRAGDDTPALVPLGLFFLSLAGVLFSAYLTYLELFVIKAICWWCVASAVIVTGIFGLSAWEVTAPPHASA
jgi:uncharacterized membrane protein